ncbi:MULTISPECIES: hypothetical protein [unclassified Marinobacter]|uniref:hypothetical protein n=1 Tax=unclassified Marinobacter TaxID=83889 RepID=UPI001268CBC0|nr:MULTISPECIES: hypothetical protein [unclassified Marinobacter]QFS88427.1 hypothetical protein FIV08_16455 [Marinobacter sp. THAF197a]QFT52212.1 hypothetical protein FIU96_16365 [Marinobacter sp. THAF39]
MNTQWLKINPSEFAERAEKGNQGRKRFISPYDLPEAVRAYESRDGNHIVFEFRYIPIKESILKKELNEDVNFEIGKASKRIYKITARKEALEKGQSKNEGSVEKMENALESLIKRQKTKELNVDAYSANKKIIHQFKGPLTEELS